MTSNENQSQRFIYIRATREKVPVTDAQFHAFYNEACRIRKREQYHHRCMCPKKYIWACDGDCAVCEYHTAGDVLSLDATNNDDGTNLYDSNLTASISMEDVISDRLLLEQLLHRYKSNPWETRSKRAGFYLPEYAGNYLPYTVEFKSNVSVDIED